MPVSRRDVVDAFRRALQGEAGRQQQLKQVHLPLPVYRLAMDFTVSVPMRDLHGQLIRFVTLPMVYSLLVDTVGNKGVDEGEKEMASLQEASQALLRFPMNLLLAPDRPEFRRLTVSVLWEPTPEVYIKPLEQISHAEKKNTRVCV